MLSGFLKTTFHRLTAIFGFPEKKISILIAYKLKNVLLCPRIEKNNVEAFRYYLVLKSRQFHLSRIMRK